LDILILTQIDVVPLCIVLAKIIGVMRMLDNGEADDKIILAFIGFPEKTPRVVCSFKFTN
jgi:inorganic pyrophosphatase